MVKQKQISNLDLGLASKVRSKRLELKMSQEELANSIGVSFQQVQKYERAQNRISSSKLVEIAKALQVDINYFIESGEYKIPSQLEALFASDTQAGYGDLDDSRTQELLELFRYFNQIKDDVLRAQIIELAKSMSGSEALE